MESSLSERTWAFGAGLLILRRGDLTTAGTDAIVNDEVQRYRSLLFLRRVAETWRIEGGEALARWQGGGTCPVS